MKTPSDRPACRNDSTAPDDLGFISELRDIIGAKLVTYIGSEAHTRVVSQWLTSTCAPAPDVAARLRVAHSIAVSLHERDGKATIQSWFMGMNPDLNDGSPAKMLREGSCDDIGNVKAAANNFIVYG